MRAKQPGTNSTNESNAMSPRIITELFWSNEKWIETFFIIEYGSYNFPQFSNDLLAQIRSPNTVEHIGVEKKIRNESKHLTNRGICQKFRNIEYLLRVKSIWYSDSVNFIFISTVRILPSIKHRLWNILFDLCFTHNNWQFSLDISFAFDFSFFIFS